MGLKFVAESKPKEKLFTWTSTVRGGLPKLTPDFGAFAHFHLTCGTNHRLLSQGNLFLILKNQFKLAVIAKANLKSKSEKKDFLEGLEVHGTAKLNDDLSSYFKYDHFKKTLALGAHYTNNIAWFETISALAEVDLKKDEKGNAGKKTFKVAAEKKLDDRTSLKFQAVHADDDITVHAFASHKISDNFTLKGGDIIKPLTAWNNRNFDTYNYGVSFNWEF